MTNSPWRKTISHSTGDESPRLKRFFEERGFPPPPGVRATPMNVRNSWRHHLGRFGIEVQTSATGSTRGSARITLLDRATALKTKRIQGVTLDEVRVESDRLREIVRGIPESIDIVTLKEIVGVR